jgi:hypothetical protein
MLHRQHDWSRMSGTDGHSYYYLTEHTDLTTRAKKVFDSPNENIDIEIANRAVSITGFRPMWSDSWLQ